MSDVMQKGNPSTHGISCTNPTLFLQKEIYYLVQCEPVPNEPRAHAQYSAIPRYVLEVAIAQQ